MLWPGEVWWPEMGKTSSWAHAVPGRTSNDCPEGTVQRRGQWLAVDPAQDPAAGAYLVSTWPGGRA
jgi:hypothetical protein